jgi:hypothetical protein
MVLLTAALLLAFTPQTVPQIQQREIHEHTQNYAIDINYPEIANADQFNAAVHQTVDPLVKNFKSEPIAARNEPTGFLNGTYTATTLKTGIVSVLLTWNEYAAGAAHPGDFMASINYDTPTGRVLALSDLFRPGVNYLSRLSKISIASLDRQEYAVPDTVRQGAGPLESNFKVFTLTDTSLVLHFPTYQVAAGAAGPQQVVIPLATLAPILRKR